MRRRYTIGIAWTIFSLAFFGALVLFRVAVDANLYLLTGIATLLLSCAAAYDCCLRGSLQPAIRKLGFFTLAVLASFIWANALCYWCSLAAGFRYMQNISKAMLPTFAPGDWILVDSRYYDHHRPQNGDIVVIDHPFSNSPRPLYLVKRISGVGGDTVEISNGKLIRNGFPVEENYVKTSEGPAFEPWLRNMTPRTIPPAEFFLLGDNRDNSYDSRAPEVGNCHESELRGKVVRKVRFF